MPTEAELAPPVTGRKSLLARRWMTVAKLLIVGAVIAGLGVAIDRSWEHWQNESEKSRLRLSDLNYRWLFAAAGLYALGLCPAIWVLGRALVSLGFRPPMRAVAAAQIIGHIGKYVPGKAMVIILRASVLNRVRQENQPPISIRAATIAITIETLTVIATGASMALILLAFLDTPAWIRSGGAVVAIGAIVGTWPPLMRLVISRRLVGGTLPFHWTMRDMIASWLWNALAWSLFGGSMMAVILALPESVRSSMTQSFGVIYITSFATVALAVVAGFLSFLPGGAGARELVISAMLAPMIGPSGAMVAAILLRLIHLAVELLMAAVAWSLLPQKGTLTTGMDV
jgi:uncharacterized membrane protein YbhN (UPF0104 family)